MAFKNTLFYGEIPKIHSDVLKDGYAEIAENVNLYHGDIRPYPCPDPYCSKQFNIESLYSYPDCPCLAFPVDTDVVRIVDEAGDILVKNDGTVTQVATVLDACAGVWCDIGVPCPTTPPLVSGIESIEEPPPEEPMLMLLTDVIDTVVGASFFCLARLDDGSLLGGTYSEGVPIPEIRQDGVTKASIDSGESIFSMVQDGNSLYVSTENNGGLYRINLSTWGVDPVHTLAGGVFGGAFDVKKIDGNIICIGGGEIYVVGVGTVFTFSSDYYVKSIYKFNGTYYVPGYKQSTNEAGHFASNDLSTWIWETGESPGRYIRGETSPNGDKVAIVGTEDYSGGAHTPDSATLWIRTTGGITKEHVFPGYDYASAVKWENNDTIIVGLTRGWRSATPGAQLVKVTDTVDVIETFDEAELRDIDIYDGSYWVATRTDTVGGSIYRVDSEVACGGFAPTAAPSQILDGHDNGIVTKGADGTVWLITGDGFVDGVKYETAVFSLAPGANPTNPGSWVFRRGLTGKCYGARCLGNTLYLLKSDTGSLWLGTQNVRIYNYDTDTSSASTLQATLESRGINWFIVQEGTGGSEITVGCVIAPTDEFWAGTTPAPLWRGDPNNLASFVSVTSDMGIPPGDVTTISAININGSWVAGVGDFKNGLIHQYCAPDLLGPWNLINTDNFSPTMSGDWDWPILKEQGFTAGPFTLNFFEVDGQWYRAVTGTGSTRNDGTWIQAVEFAGIDVNIPGPGPGPEEPDPTVENPLACKTVYSAFRYRFVHKFGYIGPPSPITELANIDDDETITVGGFEIAHNCITEIIIERAAHGFRTGEEQQTAGDWAWFLLAKIPVGEEYSGSIASLDLGYTLPEKLSRAFPPTPGMRGAAIMKTGAVVSYIGKKVVFSEPGLPHAYTGDTDFMVDDNIVDVVQHGDDVYILTDGYQLKIITLQYDNQPYYDYVTIPEKFPCVSKKSIASVGDGIIYASPVGIVLMIDRKAKVIIHQSFFIDNFKRFRPETIRAAAYGGRYFFFNDDMGIELSFGSNFYGDSAQPWIVRITFIRPDLLGNSYDGELLLVEGGNVSIWGVGRPLANPCGKSICCPGRYRSKINQSADDRRLTAFKLTFGRSSTIFDDPKINNPVDFKFIIEDCEEQRTILERTVNHCRPFRLPRQYRTTETLWEVTTCKIIREAHGAESIAELGRA